MFSANISILFSEVPFLERPQAARAAGFSAVECWWPFERPNPSGQEIADFTAVLDRAGVSLSGLNFYAGDMPAGDRGILSHPGQADVFAANLSAVVQVAEGTGCRIFNALYGLRLPGLDPRSQDDAALANLILAGRALEQIGGVILLEPLSRGDNGDYPLVTIDDALAVIDRAGEASLKLLFDAYHLHNNGFDVTSDVGRYVQPIGHIQIADSPGRGQPGTGTIDFDAFFSAVAASGYDGLIGCEYRPQGPTAESFGWMGRDPAKTLARRQRVRSD